MSTSKGNNEQYTDVLHRALFVLTPSEGKRLIAKGVKEMPEVQEALHSGKLIIAGGTTNAFIAEELTGIKIEPDRYTAGIITKGRLCVTPSKERISPVVIIKGEVVEASWEDVIEDFGRGDVFVKGANAIDASGMAGVFVASPTAGTIGRVLGTLYARGAHLIIPACLEKMVPSVQDALGKAGTLVFQHSLGVPVGIVPIVGGKIVTEITALETLSQVDAVALGAGGVGGSEGSTTIAVSGREKEVSRIFDMIKEIKGEPPVQGIKRRCADCRSSCSYKRND